MRSSPFHFGFSLSLGLLGVLLSPAAAGAQSRPDAGAISCVKARALVAQSGAVVLGTGGPTYERVVYSGQFCTPDEFTQPFWTRTADAPQCMVGYTCEPRAGRAATPP